jgi:hypothetical protein
MEKFDDRAEVYKKLRLIDLSDCGRQEILTIESVLKENELTFSYPKYRYMENVKYWETDSIIVDEDTFGFLQSNSIVRDFPFCAADFTFSIQFFSEYNCSEYGDAFDEFKGFAESIESCEELLKCAESDRLMPEDRKYFYPTFKKYKGGEAWIICNETREVAVKFKLIQQQESTSLVS